MTTTNSMKLEELVLSEGALVRKSDMHEVGGAFPVGEPQLVTYSEITITLIEEGTQEGALEVSKKGGRFYLPPLQKYAEEVERQTGVAPSAYVVVNSPIKFLAPSIAEGGVKLANPTTMFVQFYAYTQTPT